MIPQNVLAHEHQQCRLTGHTREDTEEHGLIGIFGVSRAVADGAVFLYLRAMFRLVLSVFLSSLVHHWQLAIHGLSLRTTFRTEELLLSMMPNTPLN